MGGLKRSKKCPSKIQRKESGRPIFVGVIIPGTLGLDDWILLISMGFHGVSINAGIPKSFIPKSSIYL